MKKLAILVFIIYFAVILGIFGIMILYPSMVVNIITPAYSEELACPDGRIIDTTEIYKYYAAKDFPEKYMKFFCSVPCQESPYPMPMDDYPGLFIGLSSPTGHCIEDSIAFTYVISSQNKLLVLIIYDQQKMQHKLLWVSKEAPDGLEEYLQELIDASNRLIRGEIET